jgi:ABC-type multidrug transport system ATPase subunit
VRDFSGGMRRRLGIAVALLGAPPLLIVDEPTTGLDLPSRQQLREILLRAAASRIILLSTHLASDVEAVASRLLVLRRGRLVYDGELAGLLARARGRVQEAVLGDADLLAFSRQHRVTRRVRELGGVRVRAVTAAGAPAAGRIVEPNLEEAYLAAMEG